MEKARLSVSELFNTYEADFTLNHEAAKQLLEGLDSLPVGEIN